MIELHSVDGERTEADRIPLFSIDGEEYSMPGKVKPYVSIRYLWMIRQDGSTEAAAWLMEQMLGEDGFAALASYEDLEQRDFETIMNAVKDHTMGDIDGDEGKGGRSKKGRQKSSGQRNT